MESTISNRPSQAQASLSLATCTFIYSIGTVCRLSTHHRTGHATARQLPCKYHHQRHLSVVRRSTQAARFIISSLIGSPISVKKVLIKRVGDKRTTKNCRTFLQIFEERDVQEVLFALGRISPIRLPSLPMTTFLPASRFGVAIASRFGGPAGQTALCHAFRKGERVG